MNISYGASIINLTARNPEDLSAPGKKVWSVNFEVRDGNDPGNSGSIVRVDADSPEEAERIQKELNNLAELMMQLGMMKAKSEEQAS